MRWTSLKAPIILVLLIFSGIAIYMAYVDLRYFALEKEVKSWTLKHPPTENELSRVEQSLSEISQDFNPNLLWLEAIVMEWKAYIHADNARFILRQSENKLEQAIVLRSVDARLWAHLALVKKKLSRPDDQIQQALQNAERFGANDAATRRLLRQFEEVQ